MTEYNIAPKRKTKALRCLFVFIAFCAVFCSFITKTYAVSPAIDITKKCVFLVSSNQSAFMYATDSKYITFWQATAEEGKNLEVSISSSSSIGGIYFVWSTPPENWELAADNNGNKIPILKGGNEKYLTQYISIPAAYQGYKKLKLSIVPDHPAAVELAEIRIFSPGAAPYYAPSWRTFKGRADILTIAAHPDDEDLYLSAPEVYYTNQGKKCQTVFMTYGSVKSIRRFEAQESVWSLGNRSYPTMGSFRDVRTSTLKDALMYWPLYDSVGFLVEQIRKYKPSIIVTHDINGEYGHGAHMLTEYSTLLAFQYAGDPCKYPDSALRYGTWNAGKLYSHLYSYNRLNIINLNTRLASFNNLSILQTVRNAYVRHKSQLPGRSLPVYGRYDMRRFGLLASNLGPDIFHNNMFENVSEDAMRNLNSGTKAWLSRNRYY